MKIKNILFVCILVSDFDFDCYHDFDSNILNYFNSGNNFDSTILAFGNCRHVLNVA